MSKRVYSLALLLITCAVTFMSCERDDICAASTPTTPLLIISFFDIDDTTSPKEPLDFAIVEDGTTDTIAYSGETIRIPLRTDTDFTSYRFILNVSNPDDDPDLTAPNADLVNISYTRTEEYISKACGFRVAYDMVTQQTFSGDDDDAWIGNIIVDETSLTDQTDAHIRIFH